MINKADKQIGFAILYAVLMVSIVLTISLTLLDISYKQLILSSINEESKIAYYAATSAINCALFWDGPARSPDADTSYKPFGYFTYDTIPPVFTPATPPNKSISCAGNSVLVSQDSGNDRISTFPVNFDDGSAAFVKVIKGDGTNDADEGRTLFRVDGYNTTVAGPRQVQRSIDTTL